MAELTDGGLAVYLYRYPGPPLRAADIAELLARRPLRERMVELLSFVDPAAVIEGWIGLFVRLLALGYVAGSLADLGSGIACQPQNSCLDGGFVDTGSLTPIDNLADDTALYSALHFCTSALVDTVRSLLAGREDPTGRVDGPGRFDLWAFSRYVNEQILAALHREVGAGAILDQRVLDFFEEFGGLDALWSLLCAYHTASPTGFEDASRHHTSDWTKLLRLVGSAGVG
jgi:hypothetical protein